MSSIIITSIVAFSVVILLLVFILLYAQSKLVQSGDVKIIINGDEKNPVVTSAGSTLLGTLSGQKIFLPSACGGGGTCAMCKCTVKEGGGDVLPTEVGHLSRSEQKEGVRLSCQVKVKQDMRIEIPEEIFGIKKWECEVVSNYNVASFIKEFVVKLPEGEHLEFEAGGYIQVDVPPVVCDFKDMNIEPHPEDPAGPDKFKGDWDKFGLWDLKMVNKEEIFRAYSMANHPAEGNIIMLNIRIATPPWDRANNKWMDVNPGICSSYVFTRKPGDKVTISGPYGEFFIKPTDAEMLYVGGGAGMAPMRSHLFHLFHTLKTGRKVTYWYGGRSKRELFYLEDFRKIEREFPNFQFFLVLSEPQPEDNWVEKKDINDKEGDGFLGFVHQAVIDQYLSKHKEPEEIEFYFCGPPMMNAAVIKMCEDWGVPDENVSFDDFGG
ncbi:MULTISPECIES: NADH:ubiquinone reductase (Na(+)-transporting) subunit F [Roseivirga]|jgi:Na+-transporting NADH:ubiquinone oxidoreductase subunit F|uniref:Na(+)-translocating NADH-quinone reductase subunit F n=1 Tax=Roseivirga spongicola TaxID=333140 RepID=A0A150XFK1_9BACT|nr:MULTISPECIES: NADH:ubiquinone reductase (Na(+)-transporting) subunit F [Roseivirga]PWL30088.1 MAG: NADH:ubiquinone reductase (Na(+)-transporting) subunit F [Roseivirga sp. XM-24bin3]KYG77464.1 NADH:ubiquinone reductase (Na(+)-transporting) subunit F [Roseivirga spongicola]MBO6495485.1 NADH:ubiquinone reductase (Na(+)-transporting) subunit F [Roseivirga sp.]MBO6661739.1 NADH:ubiquinone reductase (Na(+)-transporting) subunit F [Roseivirga sp.]MBO6761655.1 NADH:ubiquinone reductase (Na(+)-tran